MNNGKADFENIELKRLLKQEFLIDTDDFGEAEYAEARKALFTYRTEEAFYEDTGWARDNPEFRAVDYLIKNRICRWWNGQFIYFSRILWEREKEMESND